MSNFDKQREEYIVGLFRSGSRYSEIADLCGISAQRVAQIIKRNGFSMLDCSSFISKEERKKINDSAKALRYKNRNLDYIRRTGYSIDEFNAIKTNINDMGFTPQNAYKQHKTNSKSRKIEWKFTLKEWFEMWINSGRWKKRGRGEGMYVMARKNDKGPYSKDNVEIISFTANLSDGYAYMKKKGDN